MHLVLSPLSINEDSISAFKLSKRDINKNIKFEALCKASCYLCKAFLIAPPFLPGQGQYPHQEYHCLLYFEDVILLVSISGAAWLLLSLVSVP